MRRETVCPWPRGGSGALLLHLARPCCGLLLLALLLLVFGDPTRPAPQALASLLLSVSPLCASPMFFSLLRQNHEHQGAQQEPQTENKQQQQFKLQESHGQRNRKQQEHGEHQRRPKQPEQEQERKEEDEVMLQQSESQQQQEVYEDGTEYKGKQQGQEALHRAYAHTSPLYKVAEHFFHIGFVSSEWLGYVGQLLQQQSTDGVSSPIKVYSKVKTFPFVLSAAATILPVKETGPAGALAKATAPPATAPAACTSVLLRPRYTSTSLLSPGRRPPPAACCLRISDSGRTPRASLHRQPLATNSAAAFPTPSANPVSTPQPSSTAAGVSTSRSQSSGASVSMSPSSSTAAAVRTPPAPSSGAPASMSLSSASVAAVSASLLSSAVAVSPSSCISDPLYSKPYDRSAVYAATPEPAKTAAAAAEDVAATVAETTANISAAAAATAAENKQTETEEEAPTVTRSRRGHNKSPRQHGLTGSTAPPVERQQSSQSSYKETDGSYDGLAFAGNFYSDTLADDATTEEICDSPTGETRETGGTRCIEKATASPTIISSLCTSNNTDTDCVSATREGHNRRNSSYERNNNYRSRWLLQPVRVHTPLQHGDTPAPDKEAGAAAADKNTLQFFTSRASATDASATAADSAAPAGAASLAAADSSPSSSAAAAAGDLSISGSVSTSRRPAKAIAAARRGDGSLLLRRNLSIKSQQQRPQQHGQDLLPHKQQQQQGQLLVPLEAEQPVKVVLSPSVLNSLQQAACTRSSSGDPPQAALLYGRLHRGEQQQQQQQQANKEEEAQLSHEGGSSSDSSSSSNERRRISSRGRRGAIRVLAAAAEAQERRVEEEIMMKKQKHQKQQPLKILVEGVLLLCCSSEEKAAAAAAAEHLPATSSPIDRREAKASLAAALPVLAVLGAQPKSAVIAAEQEQRKRVGGGAAEDAPAASAHYSLARDAADRTARHLGLQLVGWAALRPPQEDEEEEAQQQEQQQQQQQSAVPEQQKRKVCSRFVATAAAGALDMQQKPAGGATTLEQAPSSLVHNLELLVTMELQAQLQQQQQQEQEERERRRQEQQQLQQEDEYEKEDYRHARHDMTQQPFPGKQQEVERQRLNKETKMTTAPMVGLLVRTRGPKGAEGIEIEAFTPTSNCWRMGAHRPQVLPTAREQLQHLLQSLAESGSSSAGCVMPANINQDEIGQGWDKDRNDAAKQQKGWAAAAASAPGAAPPTWGRQQQGGAVNGLRSSDRFLSACPLLAHKGMIGSSSRAAIRTEGGSQHIKEDAAATEGLWGMRQQQLKQPIRIDGMSFSSLPLAFLYRYLPVVAAGDTRSPQAVAASERSATEDVSQRGNEGDEEEEYERQDEGENFFLFEEAADDENLPLGDDYAAASGATPSASAKKRLVRSQVVSCTRSCPRRGAVSTRLREVLHGQLSPEAVGQQLMRSFEMLQQVASLLPHNDNDLRVLCRAATSQAGRRNKRNIYAGSEASHLSSAGVDNAQERPGGLSSELKRGSDTPGRLPESGSYLRTSSAHTGHQHGDCNGRNGADFGGAGMCGWGRKSDTSSVVPDAASAASSKATEKKVTRRDDQEGREGMTKAAKTRSGTSAGQQAEADAADVARVVRLLRLLTMPPVDFHWHDDEEDVF